MQYKVIERFDDLQDSNHAYHKGDLFPRSGVTVSDERIVELSSTNNLRHMPLIEVVLENEQPLYSKSEINRMSKDDLILLAEKEGIPVEDDTTAVTIKKELIDKFNL